MHKFKMQSNQQLHTDLNEEYLCLIKIIQNNFRLNTPVSGRFNQCHSQFSSKYSIMRTENIPSKSKVTLLKSANQEKSTRFITMAQSA